jgi:hypothetical protein
MAMKANGKQAGTTGYKKHAHEICYLFADLLFEGYVNAMRMAYC